MAYNFPEGARFQFSNTFAAAKAITIASNGKPALLTAPAHGLVDGEEFLLLSGWEDATNTIYRADQQSVDTLTALGLDTSNTAFFGAGTGVGSLQKVTDWTDIPQVLTISNSGGDARFTTVQPLSARNAIQIPTGFNAASTTLTLAHDSKLANYQKMLEISRTQQKVAFRIISGDSATYGYGYMSVSETPQMQSNQVNQVQCAISMLGRTISY